MVSEVKNCCTYRTVRTAVFNSTANMSIGNEGNFRASEIKPCEIRKDLHRMQYENHHSVNCGTVNPIHGIVVFLLVPYALLHNSKPDRVLLWTGLRRTKSERKTPSSKTLFSGKYSSPHRKLISRIYGGNFYEIEFEK